MVDWKKGWAAAGAVIGPSAAQLRQAGREFAQALGKAADALAEVIVEPARFPLHDITVEPPGATLLRGRIPIGRRAPSDAVTLDNQGHQYVYLIRTSPLADGRRGLPGLWTRSDQPSHSPDGPRARGWRDTVDILRQSGLVDDSLEIII